jgi:methylated-DNA-[protein]-cysteine S-methyltransferase
MNADFAMNYHALASPIGTLLLVGNTQGLASIHFETSKRPAAVDPAWQAAERPFQSAIAQLEEYFAGRRRTFELTLIPTGTSFQQSVWSALQAIPYGESVSYAELAARVGRPTAFRAVGAANGANPWPIVVPCHRVIGSDRSLTGFGGGLEVKRALLRLEAEVSGAAWLVPAR